MEQNVLFVGIDVDDKAYHVSVFNQLENSSFEFKTGPSSDLLIRGLKRHQVDPAEAKICYEATYVGFTIQRRLSKSGYFCEAVAPSMIPRQAGMKQKTDRIDCKKIARYYAKGLLTFVSIPDEMDEATRDLLRSKRFLIQQQTMIKNHINGLCRRMGIDFRQETGKIVRWTKAHLEWLESRVSGLEHAAAKVNFRILLTQYENVTKNIDLYESEIEHLASEPRYEKKVTALSAFKGVKQETALVLITELGDIRRFDHPRKITSYAGFDLVEYSSGGTQKRYGISKCGNPHLRRAAVDAVKFAIRSPAAGRDVRERRKNADIETQKTAAKCNYRLYKKGSRMLYAGKAKKKVQVACAREFLGFVWEVLQRAA